MSQNEARMQWCEVSNDGECDSVNLSFTQWGKRACETIQMGLILAAPNPQLMS